MWQRHRVASPAAVNLNGMTLPPPGGPNIMLAAGVTQWRGVLRDCVP